jgi:hypothetical protein
MAEIKNYSLNFGSGPRFALDFAFAKSACTEVQRDQSPAGWGAHG